VGRDTRYATFSAVVPVLERAVEHLPGKLRLTSSKRLAEARIAILRGFVAAIREEAGELLF
jgi:hypothetical protein